MYLTHSEAKQYQHVGVCNREMFTAGPTRRWVDRALKRPNSLKAFSKTFSRKGKEEVWLLVADFLVLNPLFLRSNHSQVTMFL